MNQSPVFLLLRGLVDYAGLFPPAKLPMDRVVRNYDDYRQSGQSWMLGGLIVPVGRLPEFEEAAGGLLPRSSPAAGWRISALLPAADLPATRDLSAAMREIEAFNLRHASPEFGFGRIEAVEMRWSPDVQMDPFVAILPAGLKAYLELPLDESMELGMERIASHKDRLRAKIRTGGICEELIPTPESVARFVASAVARRIPFKATAGLHHPIRASYPLTYERNPDIAIMHGFLNLLLATGGLMTGRLSESAAADLLREMDPRQMGCEAEQGWRWKNLRLGLDEIKELRQHGLESFGSCSFIEPVEDLQALGHQLAASAQ